MFWHSTFIRENEVVTKLIIFLYTDKYLHNTYCYFLVLNSNHFGEDKAICLVFGQLLVQLIEIYQLLAAMSFDWSGLQQRRLGSISWCIFVREEFAVSSCVSMGFF